MPYKNRELLEGLECPSCGGTEPLQITCEIVAKIYDTEIDSHGGMEWTDESNCVCLGCGYRHTVSKFRIEEDGE